MSITWSHGVDDVFGTHRRQSSEILDQLQMPLGYRAGLLWLPGFPDVLEDTAADSSRSEN